MISQFISNRSIEGMPDFHNQILVFPFDLIFFCQCFFLQQELVLKAKEIFVMNGPWLVHGSLEKLKVLEYSIIKQ